MFYRSPQTLVIITILMQYASFIGCTGQPNENGASTSLSTPATTSDRQLTSPQCGVAKTGGRDPFGLQAQFRTTVPPNTTTPTSGAGARNGPIIETQNSIVALPLTPLSNPGQIPNDIFFTPLVPILESDSSIVALNGSDIGNGKRHVIPRILKREATLATNSPATPLDGSLHVALPSQLCWQVRVSTQIRLSTSRFAYAHCAGSIIGPSTVLTAAHCVINPLVFNASSGQPTVSPQDMSVTMAGPTVDSCAAAGDSSDGCPQNLSVSKIIKHAGYNAVLGDNDIALMILEKPVNLDNSSCACSLCLQNDMPSVGENCLIGGYGDDLLIGNLSAFPLQWTVLKTRQASLTSAACGFNVDDAAGKTTNLDLFLCAGGTKNERSCQGDSGAPLVCYNAATASHYLAGVSAFGPPCGVNIGSMYTNVAKFLPWIAENSAGDVLIS